MFLWTSEAVSKGHPDKVADQIADAVLDAYLKVDPYERVACEVTCCKKLVLVTGEVSSKKQVDIEKIVRQTLIDIGYDRDEHCYNGYTVDILNAINSQSDQIAAAVAKSDGEIGAGDQGIMFGFACDETPTYMPLAHHLAFRVIQLLEDDINSKRGRLEHANQWKSPLLPDAKSQVTIAYYDTGTPAYIDTVLVSTQHKPIFSTKADLEDYLTVLVRPAIEDYADRLGVDPRRAKWYFNPSGLWTFGGPAADTGLSGRKIVVDNYGADCPIGGGSFSGKDPTKVDRSGAYAARYVAKNIVAAGLAKKCQVQVAYAIGLVDPVSIRVQTFETANTAIPDADNKLTELVRELVPLNPKSIIERLDLRRPIYAATASGGHFGRDGFPWENTTVSEEFKKRAYQ